MSTRCVTLSWGEVTVSVEADDAELLASIDRYLLPWAPRGRAAMPRHTAAIRIARAADAVGFDVWRGESLLARNAEWPGLFMPLQQAVDEAIVENMSRFVAIHAGAVAIDGKAILLPGHSRAGKSTLVRALVQAGAEYLSDEYALLDESGLVHPYPRALMLRNGDQEQTPVLASELSGTAADGPRPVGLIAELRYQPGAALAVDTMTRSDAVLCLSRNTPHAIDARPNMLPALIAASTHARICYSGRRGDAVEAATCLAAVARA